MCYRYALSVRPEIKDRFNLNDLPLGVETQYNIALWREIPVVVKWENKNEMMLMKWWLIPHWAKESKIWYNLWNAKAETIDQKPSFKQSFESKRCIIPASWFFEWEHIGKDKIPYYISPKEDEYFWFAWIYDIRKDQDGKDIYSVSIITTTPNDEISRIHDRMPSILWKGHENDRLYTNDKESLLKLLKPSIDTQMYKVSPEVNGVKSQWEQLIQKIS
jgi:putative SOS response-associated peptidase YedK